MPGTRSILLLIVVLTLETRAPAFGQTRTLPPVEPAGFGATWLGPPSAPQGTGHAPLAAASLNKTFALTVGELRMEASGTSTRQARPAPSKASVARKMVGSVIGLFAGVYLGGKVGAAIEGDRCRCDDPGLKGWLIGAHFTPFVGTGTANTNRCPSALLMLLSCAGATIGAGISNNR